jgi:MAP kinase interacting serine/threonine kinase
MPNADELAVPSPTPARSPTPTTELFVPHDDAGNGCETPTNPDAPSGLADGGDGGVTGGLPTPLSVPVLASDDVETVSSTTAPAAVSPSSPTPGSNESHPHPAVSPPAAIEFAKKKKKKRSKPMTPNEFKYRYELVDVVLGEGSFATVNECKGLLQGRCLNGWMREVGKTYAVKVIRKFPDATMQEREDRRDQVLRETELLMLGQNHPHILQLLDQYETEFDHKLVFEKVEGGELFAHIQERRTFTEREASEVTSDMASALSFLHGKGIVHRDLKPQNILCVRTDQASPCKICDFNLGYSASSNNPNSLEDRESMSPTITAPVGTPEFMSPEVVATIYGMGESTYDKRTDVWSLGVILYIMLSGQPPFAGDCGYDCGWKRGESCDMCQDMLEDEISDGFIEIEAPPWDRVSGAAKDLVCRMLVPEDRRLPADQILQHPWIKQKAPATPLDTPLILRRTSTMELLEDFVSDANATHRTIDEHRPQIVSQLRGHAEDVPLAAAAGHPRARGSNPSTTSSGSDTTPFFAPSPLSSASLSASSGAVMIPVSNAGAARQNSFEQMLSFRNVRSLSLDNILTPELQRRAGSPTRPQRIAEDPDNPGAYRSPMRSSRVGSFGSPRTARLSSFGSSSVPRLDDVAKPAGLPAFIKRRLAKAPGAMGGEHLPKSSTAGGN